MNVRNWKEITGRKMAIWVAALAFVSLNLCPELAYCAEKIQPDEMIARADQYNQAEDQLKRKYPSTYWIGSPFVVQDPKTTEVYSTCAWTNFIPTVMPIVESVVIVTVTEKNAEPVKGWLPQIKLQEIVGAGISYNSIPVPHLVTSPTVPLEVRERIVAEMLPMDIFGKLGESTVLDTEGTH